MPFKKSCPLFAKRDLKLIISIVGLLTAFEVSATMNPTQSISEKTHPKSGTHNSNRLVQWHELIEDAKDLPELEKVIKVNDFFNQHIVYVRDYDLWGVNDYWATPSEILNKGAGDCEDYSIAKFFTLKKLGISENKIRITYVKDLKRNQAHMVLTYTATPGGLKVILDNLIPEITLASNRKDLSPLYSFNNTGLWLANFNQNSKRVGSSNQLDMWSTLTQRM